MIIRLNKNQAYSNYNIYEDEQFHNVARTIYLNSIKTTSLNSNPLIKIFDVILNGFQSTLNDITEVTVSNKSIVSGTIHTKSDRIIRQNKYTHHGIIRQPIELVGPDSLVEFADVDFVSVIDNNYISGKPGSQGNIDVTTSNRFVLTDYPNDDSVMPEITPDPMHYDEIDMVKTGYDSNGSYIDSVFNLHWSDSTVSPFTIPLRALIDKNTKIYKRNINVENMDILEQSLSGTYSRLSHLHSFVTNIVSEIALSMENNCVTSGTFIFGGSEGFNIRNISSTFVVDSNILNANLACLKMDMENVNCCLPDNIRLIVDVKDLSNFTVSFTSKTEESTSSNILRPEINDVIGIR